MKRRKFLAATLQATLAAPVICFLPHARASSLPAGLNTSDLIYLTPIKSNGKESRCQAEIWFVWDGSDIYVCTNTNSWRATAPQKGLTTTRIWVGDLGQWGDTGGKYKNLPVLEAQTSLVADDEKERERILDLFGDKYRLSWLIWGPRFRKGLKDGSRSLIRYRPIS